MKQVFDALERHAQTRPDAIAFEDDSGQISWQDLSHRVENLAYALDATSGPIGIGLAGGIDYVVADLAATLSGKRQVPLPFFFSTAQNAHVLMDARVGTVITNTPELFSALPHLNLLSPVTPAAATPTTGRGLRTYDGGAERIIYTSGSSGTPKGVVLGDRQLQASISALSQVIAADETDTHLSILPLAQLLEQICGIFLPIVAGAKTVFRFEATKALFGAPIEPLVAAFEILRPTTSLLAPAVLGRWVSALAGRKAPDSLRFVAVGGASSSPSLIHAAQDLGIPVHEGYGLSECCAVVAMNRPGDNHPGTVGPVLEGLKVSLEDGEIVVSGPTVMTGYLNGAAAPDVWHTGDLGHFDGDRLVVDGRKDALLVTSAGRNISPEWVEQRVNSDPRVVSSALGLRQSDGALILLLVVAAAVPASEIIAYLSDLPSYARPSAVIITDPSEQGLLFPAGTPNRAVAARLINTRPVQQLDPAPESIAS
ncbi:AMP-binding protein [Pseudophaeobacter arcticus]|jgi:long-subunit acyl-CoA synthetase (AMP-forming)|uniref:AMP-binding protein n=1 Tax=Pseudophaeobacter arcticus TaxID=385492 RepID=UPI0039E340FF